MFLPRHPDAEGGWALLPPSGVHCAFLLKSLFPKQLPVGLFECAVRMSTCGCDKGVTAPQLMPHFAFFVALSATWLAYHSTAELAGGFGLTLTVRLTP